MTLYRKSIEQGLYDGIIGHIERPDDFNFIIRSKTPAVLKSIYSHMDGEILTCDNTAIGNYAADLFLEKEIKNFAYFGSKKLYFSNERLQAFSDRLSPHTPHAFSTGINITRIGTEKIADWLRSLPKPIGIFACNDD